MATPADGVERVQAALTKFTESLTSPAIRNTASKGADAPPGNETKKHDAEQVRHCIADECVPDQDVNLDVLWLQGISSAYIPS